MKVLSIPTVLFFVMLCPLVILSATAQDTEQAVLYINVNGNIPGGYNYEPDSKHAYEMLVAAKAKADYLDLKTEGEAVAMLQQNTYDQIWVIDLSHTGTYPADWEAIAEWFNAHPQSSVICDGRFLSSFWSGRYADHGAKLAENYYVNLKIRGGGLVLGTDDLNFHPGINDLMPLLGFNLFSGIFGGEFPVDTENPLMNTPNVLGLTVPNDSSTGSVPYGLQPNGLIFYSIGWHSNNPDTPGISSTIEGLIGFHINITDPQNEQIFNSGEIITLTAEPKGGEEPYTYAWYSSLDGELGTGNPLSVSTLSTGTHIIMIQAYDKMNRVDKDSVTITVEDTPIPSDCSLDISASGYRVLDSLSFPSPILLPPHTGPVFSKEGGLLAVVGEETNPAVFSRIFYKVINGPVVEVARFPNATPGNQILNLFASGAKTVCIVIGNPNGEGRCVIFLETPFDLTGIFNFTLH